MHAKDKLDYEEGRDYILEENDLERIRRELHHIREKKIYLEN